MIWGGWKKSRISRFGTFGSLLCRELSALRVFPSMIAKKNLVDWTARGHWSSFPAGHGHKSGRKRSMDWSFFFGIPHPI